PPRRVVRLVGQLRSGGLQRIHLQLQQRHVDGGTATTGLSVGQYLVRLGDELRGRRRRLVRRPDRDVVVGSQEHRLGRDQRRVLHLADLLRGGRRQRRRADVQ